LVYFSHFGMFGPRKIWQPCTPPPSKAAEGCRNFLLWPNGSPSFRKL
jgi:hypothetical protein